MQSSFDQFELDSIYQNQIGFETVEKMLPYLPAMSVSAINIFRFIRHYLVEGGMGATDVPVTEIALHLERAGLPLLIAGQIESLFETQFPAIYCINFNVLEEMELVLIKKHIFEEMLDKIESI
ncbi:MAG: hypothetical protein CMD81_08255 [Gammaproteobacteria bacterium]|nr:hypothetical protein [Gammaproteobacteria bacterium]HBF07872.1 hypothetical protein [Gammaproteobacteria bacterium]